MPPEILSPLGQISITFQDKDPEQPELVAVSVTDVRRALEALQFAVWTTAALELGRSGHDRLTDQELRQYELAVVGNSEGSLKTDLMFVMAVALLGQTGIVPHDLMIALETAGILKAWNTLETAIDAMSAEYGEANLTPTAVHQQQGLPSALSRYVRKFARSARNSGHEIRVFANDPLGRQAGLQTNPTDNLRILGPRAEQDDTLRLESPDELDYRSAFERDVFEYADGQVEDSADGMIVVKFPEYTRPIPCWYRLNLVPLIGNLLPGDTLTLFGRPKRDADDRPDAPPRELEVIDVTNVRHNRHDRL